MSEVQMPIIPYDMYESPQELVIILPLGAVKKESVEIQIADYRILIKGIREQPKLKSSCIPIQEDCYR
jgi:HSP20 family molecular chaperone IbpA